MKSKLIIISTGILFLVSLCFSSCRDEEKSRERSSTAGEFTDERDGQVYRSIRFGRAEWMAENLNYNAGEGSWVYDDQPDTARTYGRLYNWETARIACPDGWHLPVENEWRELINFLGGEEMAGGRMKEEGDMHWAYWEPDTAYGDRGFSALPAGYRREDGTYGLLGRYTFFWSADPVNITYAYYHQLHYMRSAIRSHFYFRDAGFSVRCVRDY